MCVNNYDVVVRIIKAFFTTSNRGLGIGLLFIGSVLHQ